MAYWLMKSEPGTYSWSDLVTAGRDHWDGVRNYQASNNMKAMRQGDEAFFYHSVKENQVVGIMRIVKEYYPDPTDEKGRFGMVDVEPVAPLPHSVTLAQIKEHPALQDMALIKQSRLSVMPVTEEEWHCILSLGDG